MNKAISIMASMSCLVISAADVPDLTDSLEYLGNPNYSRWPSASTSRNVTQFCVHGGRILLSGGDWYRNTGPCPIFAVDPYTGDYEAVHTAGTDRVDFFRAGTNGHVFIPSIDPNEHSDTCCDVTRLNPDGTWTDLKTAPKTTHGGTTDDGFHSIHTLDATVWKGKLFTAGYGLAVGPELSTSRLADAAPDITTAYYDGTLDDLRRFEALLPFDDDLIAVPLSGKSTGRKPSYWSFDEDEYEEFLFNEDTETFVRTVNSSANVTPGLTHADFELFSATANGVNIRLWNPVKFNGRILYTIASEDGKPVGALFSAVCENHHVKAVRTNIESGAIPFCAFVRGDVVCAVAARYDSGASNVVNSVWESTDGINFTKKFTFTASHHASALAYYDGCYFFAMGARSVVESSWTYQGADLSGQIYRIRAPEATVSVIAETASRYVPEGESCDVTFRLASAPATNMTLRVWTTNEKIGLSESSLTFTPSNWNVAQTVRASFPEDWIEEAVGGAVVCGTGGNDCVSGFVQLDMLDDEGDLTTPISGGVTEKSSYWDVNLQAEHAFDGNRTDSTGRWLARRKDHMYVVYKFDEATTVNMLRVWNASDTYGGYDSAGRSPKAWTFEGSNDGKNWTVLDTVTDQTGWSSTGEMREYSFQNGTAYQYYKYDCTALNDEVSLSKNADNQPEAQVLQLWELEFLYRREYDPTPVEILNPDGTADFYVSTVGSDSNTGLEGEPFATIGAAVDAANAAIAGGATSVTIHVAAGTHVGSGYTLDGAVTVVGAGAGQTVVDGNGGYRVFSLLNSGAALKNIAVSNAVFAADQDCGAGVYMEAGLVEDCAVVSCGDFSHIKTMGGGVYASGGRISRTVFKDNKVHMRWSGEVGYGSALFLSNGAICENSLFTGNASAPCFDWNADHRRGGVVCLTDAETALVNCTVVKNDLADVYGNVTDSFAGIVSKFNAMVVNCVAYGNIPDALYAVSNGDFYAGGDTYRNNWQNFVVNSAWGTAIRDTPSSIGVDAASFADYSNGDFRPSAVGFLFDSGSDEEYDAKAVSSKDVAGALRKQGASIDIGGYELQVAPELSVTACADSYGLVVGAAATFTASAVGGSGSYTYRWDFGDGSSAETTANASVQHAFEVAGRFHATVCVSDDGGSGWSAPVGLQHAVVVAPADIYVDAANANPVFPYDAPAKAAATFAEAYGCLTNTVLETQNKAVVDGVTVHVAAGTYVGMGYVLAGAVTVKGAGLGKTVMDGNGGYRVFTLASPGAALKNLAVSNAVFSADEDKGAGVYMEAGLVENCAMLSCGDFSHIKTMGGGIYASGGRICRTVFKGCKVHTRYSGNVGYGSALYLSNGAVCENSLFTGNAAASCFDWGAEHRRGGVVHLVDSGTALVNCSVVGNSLADASGNNNNNYAGIVQKFNAVVVNCVSYGNRPDASFVESYGDVYAGGDANRNNKLDFFVNSAWSTSINSVASPIALTDASFRNYARGLYAPKTGGALVDAGTSWDDYLGYGAKSAVDLDGKPRKKGARLDIGCYESAGLYLYIFIR